MNDMINILCNCSNIDVISNLIGVIAYVSEERMEDKLKWLSSIQLASVVIKFKRYGN